MCQTIKKEKAFTLIELLVVIAIIGLLASIIFISINSAREKGKAAEAVSTADAFRKAVELYNYQIGFYPPDTNRGWDPGFMKSLPWNPDTGATAIQDCPHCPSDWQTQAQTKWDGPYLSSWPNFTPWGGKYDYNYWPLRSERYGCSVPSGIYIGIQRDYSDNNQISQKAEQWMLDNKIDADNCLNGEAQLILFSL